MSIFLKLMAYCAFATVAIGSPLSIQTPSLEPASKNDLTKRADINAVRQAYLGIH